ncbi:MAG TPA: transcriptional regulator [Candidatus Dormibacteraeota bacterium]|nr:transcriptional regulator [Candidatus Dormibacteraeota bacterium]
MKQTKRTVKRGIDLRPGSVRQARREAGLTMAQVGGDERSRTAIYLIEVGRSRPTPETLQLIAERTGKPVEYFLPGTAEPTPAPTTSDEEHLEVLLRSGAYGPALETADRLLEREHGKLEEAWLRLRRGMALVNLGRPDDALPDLRAAQPIFEETGDRWMVVECQEWEATALSHMEDPAALPVAEQALERCRDLHPRPHALETRILSRLAALYVSRYEWSKAVELSERMVEAAGSIYDLRRMATMYNDLSIAYAEMGDPARASTYSQKALVLHDLLRDQFALARAENNLGFALMRLGKLNGAQLHMERSLALCRQIGIERGQGHVLLSLAELHLVKGEHEQAADRIEAAKNLTRGLGEQATLALAHQLAGKVAAAAGDADLADREFAAALDLLRMLNQPARLAGCHAAYAEVLERRGDTALALQHMKHALHSSQGGASDWEGKTLTGDPA